MIFHLDLFQMKFKVKKINMIHLIHIDSFSQVKKNQNKSKLLKINLKTPKKMSQEIIERMQAKKNNQIINLNDSE